MRHQKSGRKLGRNSSHRKAMFRNMVTSLFEHGGIQTTEQRAKELRRIADRMITYGKKGTLNHRRLALSYIRSEAIVAKLFDEIAPGFAEREGGYTRILKIDHRRGDNARVARIELMPPGPPEPKKKQAPRSVAPKMKATAAVPETKERFQKPKAEKAEAKAAEKAEAEAPQEAAAAVTEAAAEVAEDVAAEATEEAAAEATEEAAAEATEEAASEATEEAEKAEK